MSFGSLRFLSFNNQYVQEKAVFHDKKTAISKRLKNCIFKALILNAEEATRIDKAICGSRLSVRPYGELGTVEKNTFCCFVCFDSNLGTVMTGWGCDSENADLFVRCMKERINDRGDAAQAILSDQIIERSMSVNQKLDRVMLHIGMNPSKFEMEDREIE